MSAFCLFLAFATVVIVLKLARWNTKPIGPRRLSSSDIQSGHLQLRCGCLFSPGKAVPCEAHKVMAELV